ncbi:MAG: redoxin domain-containing protein [Planctomycetota bacterium]
MLDGKESLDVTNNNVMVSGRVPRTLTDEKGNFSFDYPGNRNVLVFVRDLEDQCILMSIFLDERGFGQIMIQRPGTIKGRLLKGDEPVKKQRITAYYYDGTRVLTYMHRAVTDSKGTFEFNDMMAGRYLIQVVQEVPQVGCCFRSVITRQMRIRVNPGQEREIKLGGTDMPYLHGKITDSQGRGLHGVWVQLKPEKQMQSNISVTSDPKVVFSDVTERDGSYSIFDIPPGRYRLHCFRRLALNDYGLTFQAEREVIVNDKPENKSANSQARAENIFDVSIDLEPFKPLEYDKQAPAIHTSLTNGKKFDLSDHKGKVVILYFYASWCSACGSASGYFNEMSDRIGSDKMVVIGINLDENIEDCLNYVKEKQLRYPQVYAGPWEKSKIRKDYHVVNTPTSFVIDREGKISQIDVFGPTLEKYVKKLLGI